MRLVFIHGWALGPEIWDGLASLLPAPQIRVDLGFFGAPGVPPLQGGDILVGHSAGLLWGLRQRGDWAGMVAINSFARFCLDSCRRRLCAARRAARHAAGAGARRQILRRFLPRQSRAGAGDGKSAKGAPDGRARPFARLRRHAFAGGRPALVLGAADDKLAPPAAARRLAEISGGTLEMRDSGGHGLPSTAPEFCAEKIAGFLSAHDF